MKKCKICGLDKSEEHFKAFKAKDGMRRMKICNTCRSRRDSVKVRERVDSLAGYSDIDLMYALQLRGYMVVRKTHRYDDLV
jgi:hypothetical protein